MKRPAPIPMPMPRSLSVAPAPRPTERALVAMGRALRGRDFGDAAEMDEFLRSEDGQRAMAMAEPEDSWERAQEVAYDAWEASGAKRYQLAREALALDERCSDAWLILAEEERTWRKQKRRFERAIAAADRFGQEEELLPAPAEEEKSSLYATIPGRTIVRAYLAMARCQMEGGHHKEAQAIYEKLLELDPEDHMGVRFEILVVYHLRDDRPGLRTLLDRYPDDAMTALPYERLWLALADGAGAADVERLEQAARETNPHVLAYLLGKREISVGPSEYVSIGGEDEAASYAEMALGWWLDQPNTQAWLKEKYSLTS